MESIAKLFNQNPYISFVSFLIGVIGIILTIVFFLIGRKYKRLTYSKKVNKLISLRDVAVESLHLFFNKEEIYDASITRIAVWNSGKDVINPSDIVESRLLSVGVERGQEDNCHILDCSIAYRSNADNKLQISHNEENKDDQSVFADTYSFSFNFLESGDGMIIQIIHTGESDNIKMDCHIKGGKKLESVDSEGHKHKLTKINIFGNRTINMYKVLYLAALESFPLCMAIYVLLVYYKILSVNSFETMFYFCILIIIIILTLIITLSISIPKNLQKNL